MRYAVATNGWCWIVFKAVREDMPWHKGSAKVFPSLEAVAHHFTDFWNLLGYESVQKGSLDAAFGQARAAPRGLHRVVDALFNSDVPLQRNRLHAQLSPLIRAIFEDIADQEQVEILQNCYVHDASLKVVARDLDVVVTDAIPVSLRDEGVRPLAQRYTPGGALGTSIEEAVGGADGQLMLLLGGIGSGKTTFLKRYERTVGHDVLAKTLWFHVDFLSAPPEAADTEDFVWTEILQALRTRYSDLGLERRRSIRQAFGDEIQALEQTALAGYRRSSEDYQRRLDPYLEEWQRDRGWYVPRLLRLCKARTGAPVVIFIDNVDQLSPDHQARIFLLAQRVTRTVGAVTVVALREESYYAASVQRSFTAYTNRKFHIASPHFPKLISNRIAFALRLLVGGTPRIPELFDQTGIMLDREAIADFLRIVQYSIFERNRNIGRFIEAVCFGNMRQALQMFATFLVSGATDVTKMLDIYQRQGAYFVAFHEFLKSVMLGDRRHYKEDFSFIMNVLNCSASRNSSHFTSLRALRVLLSRRGESTRLGRGFVDLGVVVPAFGDVFDNVEDLVGSLNRLVQRQLVETNTRSTDTIDGASHVRVTSAGWYYLNYLAGSFPYLDLVLEDTPLADKQLRDDLANAAYEVRSLEGRPEARLERLGLRFGRVERFLGYLRAEEESETGRFGLSMADPVLGGPFVPTIEAEFSEQKAYITRRLDEAQERVAEDVRYGSCTVDVLPEDDEEPQPDEAG
jgi:hypothetical protein